MTLIFHTVRYCIATRLRCGGIYNDDLFANLVMWKKFENRSAFDEITVKSTVAHKSTLKTVTYERHEN